MCDGYNGNYYQNCEGAVRQFLVDMDSIDRTGAGGNLDWSQTIQAESADVWEMIDAGYTARQRTSPLHLIRLIRNKYEHIEDINRLVYQHKLGYQHT